VHNLDLTYNVVLYTPAIQQTVISSHGTSNLTNPVNFLRCYSFMANLVLDTVPFLTSLKTLCSQYFYVYASKAWCVPSTLPAITNTISEACLAIDVGMSSKHLKMDSDGGSDSGGVSPKGQKHKKKDHGGLPRGCKRQKRWLIPVASFQQIDCAEK
jgi:hypothetical protein